jgi:hypothetical protein
MGDNRVPVQPPADDTTSSKALTAALLNLLGLLGVTLSDGTQQVVAAVVTLAVVTFGVWRVRNHPKLRKSRRHQL